jgi:hypothetical protein
MAVDPGDEHVGVAWFDRQGDAWGCVYVEEMTPDEFYVYLEQALHSGWFDYLIVESWALYRDMAMKLIGSEMETSQLIGMIKYVVWKVNSCSHMNPMMEREVELVFQAPKIKRAVFAILARKGYKFAADRLRVPAQHVRDAEVHGVKFIKDTKGWKIHKESELWTEPPHDKSMLS